MPTEHDGSSFTFELHFSENPEVSFRTLKNHAFTVDEGDVTRAQRKNPQSADKNKAWTITVEPDGNETLSITLPATTSCSSNRGICTDDERKLSHSTSATVEGPVGISVGDVEVEEGAGVVLAFQVALTRAASSALTIDYSTSDGTATAGADYTSTSGTLTIGAGSSSGTVEVSVIDDEHNEGSETFTLTLSNASSGTLTDGSATGTITNHDALPKALIARFGRTAAVHIVDQVEERVNAPRAPGFDGRVAGRQINQDMGRDFALDFLQQLGGGYGHQQGQPGRQMTAAGANDPRVGNGGMTSSLGPQNAIGGAMGPSGSMQGLHPGQSYDHGMGMGLGGDRLLQGSSFALNRATSSGGVLSFWSRSAQSRLHGRGRRPRAQRRRPDLDVRRRLRQGPDGHRRVAVAQPGARNVRRRRQRTGQLGGDRPLPLDRVQGQRTGHRLDRRRLRRRRPYAAPGRGSTDRDGAVDGDGGRRRPRADPRRRRRLRPRVQGGHAMGRNADEGREHAGGGLDSTTAAVSRLRTALEGSQSMTIAGRMALTPSVEVRIRQDGGDAETGRGIDLGAGLVLADGVTGLAVDIRVRRLLVHQAAGFAESGMAISVSYNPTPSTPLGFSARVSPAWGGDAMSGAEALWGRESMADMSHDPLMNGGGQRLDTEVGYGLPIGSRFVGTPRAGVRTSEYGRDYRIGYGMQVLERGGLNLQLGVDAERRESPIFHLQEQSGGTDHRVLGHATVQW